MILRSLHVEGWRCFVSPFGIGPFTDGLNIVHGPNGIGKSSLMLALARGLFDSHNVGGADIKTLRPWGRELAPKVTIEFEQGGDQFQLHKQFLDSPQAKLAKKENGRFVPVAESRAADERARQILAGEASSRGASDHRHWGLAQILWAAQGNLMIGELASGTRATIQDTLGAQIAGSGTENLEQRIADIYRQYFTATGKLRAGAAGPAIVNLKSQLEKEHRVRLECQQRLQDFDTASRRIEDLQLQTQSARRNEQELDEKLTKAREQVQAYQILLQNRSQHQLEVAAAEETYRRVAERIDSIRKASQELSDVSIRLTQFREALPAQEKLVAQDQDSVKLADQKVKALRGRRGEAAAARQLAQRAERYNLNRQNCIAWSKQLQQIEDAEIELKRLRQVREPIVAPDKKQLNKINKIVRQRDDARSRLDAALITVSLKLDADTQIEVTQAEAPGSHPVGRHKEFEIKGAPDVAFRIEGVGQFRATGPAGDFEAVRQQWESAATKLDELTAGFGTSDIASLESLHAQADEMDKKIAQIDVKLETLLDGANVEKLRSELALANRTLDEILEDQADWKSSPPDASAISRQADEIEQKLGTEIENAESLLDRARETYQTSSRKHDKHKAEIANFASQATTLQQRLELARNDGLDDNLRAEKLTAAALERDAAKGKLTLVEKQIVDQGDDPSKMLAMLEDQQKAFRSEADDAEKKLNVESGRLEQIVSEAPYSTLVGVEEEISRLEDEIGRQQIQMDAIRLLQETVTEQKREVIQSLIDPIRIRANIMLQRIAGSQFEGVQFDESLLPTGIAPRSHDEAVSLHQISGGEQEQVHFAVRMALADVAFPSERQLVVLDDVFTYTDAPRLARIAKILGECAERFQIVLLTCHPERYRGLPNATFFDVEELASENPP
jgi:DNA repair exonuclease SbcCD ATPase subunit